jgi:hypothetical protein
VMGQVYQCWWRMCREINVFFFQVRISHVLHFISISELFTDSPSYFSKIHVAMSPRLDYMPIPMLLKIKGKVEEYLYYRILPRVVRLKSTDVMVDFKGLHGVISQNTELHNHCCESLKSYKM